ncbi:MAG: hypothetical protein ABTQ28_02975 [Thauera sp.]
MIAISRPTPKPLQGARGTTALPDDAAVKRPKKLMVKGLAGQLHVTLQSIARLDAEMSACAPTLLIEFVGGRARHLFAALPSLGRATRLGRFPSVHADPNDRQRQQLQWATARATGTGSCSPRISLSKDRQ